jgi:hypothetical protein
MRAKVIARVLAVWTAMIAHNAMAEPVPIDLPVRAAQLLDQAVIPQQPGRFAPRDECASVSGAREFRLALAQAVLQRDAGKVADMASEDVQLGFGGDDGRDRFRNGLDNAGSTGFVELERVLALGCAVSEDGTLTMPWAFAQDIGDLDVFDVVQVLGSDVPLYTTARRKSPERGRLSWEYVTPVSGFDDRMRLVEVVTTDGKRGFVARDRLRSPIDYRLIAERQGNAWRITAFVAGD